MKKKHKPAIIIVDHVKDRCLRQEAALDSAIEEKRIYAAGLSNFGEGYIHRTGVPEEKHPFIEIDSLNFFPPYPNQEMTYEHLCKFLDMLLSKGMLQLIDDMKDCNDEVCFEKESV